MPAPIATIEEFYAHALVIEREAAERYAQFAACFSDRGEDALADLCSKLSSMEREHFDGLAAACAELALPAINVRRYQWLEADAPETAARELLCRVATPRMLLEIALAAEWRAREFFAQVARSAPLREIRELASVMAAEEAQHVRWVRNALELRPGASPAPPGAAARDVVYMTRE